MKKTDNKKLIIFAFFLKKLITDDFCKNVYPNKKKTYVLGKIMKNLDEKIDLRIFDGSECYSKRASMYNIPDACIFSY